MFLEGTNFEATYYKKADFYSLRWNSELTTSYDNLSVEYSEDGEKWNIIGTELPTEACSYPVQLNTCDVDNIRWVTRIFLWVTMLHIMELVILFLQRS